MVRAALCSVAALAILAVGLVRADNQKNTANKDQTQATITKVDPQKGTITVRMKDKSGKEEERTFTLTGEAQLFDENGKTVRMTDIDVFRSGDEVLIVEREGKLQEVHKQKPGGGR